MDELRWALCSHDVGAPIEPDEMRTLACDMEEALVNTESGFSHPDWRYVDGLRALADRDDPEAKPRPVNDAALFAYLDLTYAAADFADAEFPGKVILKFALPAGTPVSAHLRATLIQALALARATP
jgi:hypothetical protein